MEDKVLTIWKYPLKEHTEVIEVPKGYRLLSVISQFNTPTVYYLVDPTQETEQVRFLTFGTGWDLTERVGDLDFVGTVSTCEDTLILHVFKEDI